MAFVAAFVVAVADFVAMCVCGDLRGVQNYNKAATTNAY